MHLLLFFSYSMIQHNIEYLPFIIIIRRSDSNKEKIKMFSQKNQEKKPKKENGRMKE